MFSPPLFVLSAPSSFFSRCIKFSFTILGCLFSFGGEVPNRPCAGRAGGVCSQGSLGAEAGRIPGCVCVFPFSYKERASLSCQWVCVCVCEGWDQVGAGANKSNPGLTSERCQIGETSNFGLEWRRSRTSPYSLSSSQHFLNLLSAWSLRVSLSLRKASLVGGRDRRITP